MFFVRIARYYLNSLMTRDESRFIISRSLALAVTLPQRTSHSGWQGARRISPSLPVSKRTGNHGLTGTPYFRWQWNRVDCKPQFQWEIIRRDAPGRGCISQACKPVVYLNPKCRAMGQKRLHLKIVLCWILLHCTVYTWTLKTCLFSVTSQRDFQRSKIKRLYSGIATGSHCSKEAR